MTHLYLPPSQADSLSDTSFDSDAYVEGGGGSSTEVGSEASIGGGGDEAAVDEDSAERRKRNKGPYTDDVRKIFWRLMNKN